MEIWKYNCKEIWIRIPVVVLHNIKNCEDDMQSVRTVECHQYIVEADPFLVEEDHYGEEVTNDAHTSQAKHDVANEGRVGLEVVLLIDYCHVLQGVVAPGLVIVNYTGRRERSHDGD